MLAQSNQLGLIERLTKNAGPVRTREKARKQKKIKGTVTAKVLSPETEERRTTGIGESQPFRERTSSV
jgi:hypothetical protein